MNIALIDDSDEDMSKLSLLIHQFFVDKYGNMPLHISSFQNESYFLEEYKKYSYDMIFIDYYLKKITGMDLAKKIRLLDKMAVLIFTTISRDFAVESYRVKASGYLIKPIKYTDFEEMMMLINCKKIQDNQFIEIANGSATTKVLIKDIIYCDIFGHYIRIHTIHQEVIKYRQTFAEFEKQLSEFPEFLSCYRGCMINMLKVKKVNDFSFTMINGESIPFRTKQKNEIIKCYSDFLFEMNREGK